MKFILLGEYWMIHTHVTTWVVAILLFFISFLMQTQGKEKAQKITHMILRLFYLLIIGSGGYLVYLYQFMGVVLVKSVIGIIVIMAMELVLVRKKKGKSIKASFTLFGLAFILVLYYGYFVIG